MASLRIYEYRLSSGLLPISSCTHSSSPLGLSQMRRSSVDDEVEGIRRRSYRRIKEEAKRNCWTRPYTNVIEGLARSNLEMDSARSSLMNRSRNYSEAIPRGTWQCCRQTGQRVAPLTGWEMPIYTLLGRSTSPTASRFSSPSPNIPQK